MLSVKKIFSYPWLQVAGLTVAVSVLGMLSAGSRRKQQKYYTKQLKEPKWAPPGWVFGPAWTLNNVFLVKALLHLVKTNGGDMPQRNKLLLLQAVIWINFFSFGYVFFKKRSPLLGAAVTQTDAIAALSSFLLAYKSDKKLSFHYLPLTLWTLFASSIGWYTALKNPDDLFHTKAMLN